MTEFELIGILTKHLPIREGVVIGAGDDCAVLDVGNPERHLLFKTDAVVEGVHFTGETPPEKVGRKALARCLSDIAAMTGRPLHAVVTLGLPADYNPARIQAIYHGMNGIAAKYGVSIVGGETTTNPDRILISVAMIGDVEKGKAVLRKGAQTGDAIFVTGELGGSMAGKHLDFEPRIQEAQWLGKHFHIHAMMDLSDGLAGDLPHILEASGGVGAELLAASIPVSPAAKKAARNGSSPKSPLSAALTDGEDFELLFTLAAKDAVRLLDSWKARFPDVSLKCIGKITAEKGVRIKDRKGMQEIKEHGYVHFS